jgi:hypothetical protein
MRSSVGFVLVPSFWVDCPEPFGCAAILAYPFAFAAFSPLPVKALVSDLYSPIEILQFATTGNTGVKLCHYRSGQIGH